MPYQRVENVVTKKKKGTAIKKINYGTAFKIKAIVREDHQNRKSHALETFIKEQKLLC
jgi:hypothetical protein